ncbi:ParB/RepB/Spo0J family partition protein [Candidatus Nitrosocosmicus franklandus]|uniref:Chromosome-partitioning protein Spo0J n=1 Tax=Candidatus Nitrosocosmicus franklandianus TaxID=1798806 RepID=A0A484I7X3_9ARCH|nr:ParB/RepB/Spo0J family partition protein [Candidatus Nitrosocosmicus franklandus]VFJ13818.1 Chromosome-partitioning protein Spo0J [Candidatus Nitrosocosmicus franklandus]
MHVFDTSIVEHIEIKMIRPSQFSIRDKFNDYQEVESLISSIKEHGLLQPILIRPYQNNFEIVAGHRRFYACKSLRWRHIPCKIREMNDKQAFEIQLTENIQRKSMSVLEEAEAFRKYVQDLGWGGVTELAKKIGKSEEYVSHRIQLLKLPQDIKEKIMLNKLSVSQALELTTLSSGNILQFADHIIENELTVRQIREVKSVFSKKGLSGDDLELIANENINLKNIKTLKITKKTTLALKITLARIDSIIEEVQLNFEPEQSTDVISFLMDMRLKIHSLIDDTIRFKNIKINKTTKHLKG